MSKYKNTIICDSCHSLLASGVRIVKGAKEYTFMEGKYICIKCLEKLKKENPKKDIKEILENI